MGPFVSDRATIHPSVILHPGVWIGPNVTIDEGVVVGHNSVIGGMPEHRDFYDDVGFERSLGVHIKKNSRIFEFVTVHAGTKNTTIVGENVAIFNKSHVAHDCILEKGCTIGGQVSLAGHVHVMEGANISGKSCLVQWAVIGAYGFVGGFTFQTRHLPPGEKWLGFPSRYASNNDVGLRRAGLTYKQCVDTYTERFNQLIIGRAL